MSGETFLLSVTAIVGKNPVKVTIPVCGFTLAAPAAGAQTDQTNQYVHAWDDRASLVYTAT